MNKKIVGIILAGGRSSRYAKKYHKFLDNFSGKPMIVRTLEAIAPVVDQIVVVTGTDNSEIKQTLKEFQNIQYAIQKQPLGTGHALLSTDYLFENADFTLIVSYADKPLVTTRTFKLLVDQHIKNCAEITIATALLPIPGSKGRIIRKNGKFVDVVETKDADSEILKINEVNAGFIVCETRSIYKELRKINNNNATNEYYLTAVYAEYIKDGFNINTVEIPPEESCDINTISELKNINQWIMTVRGDK
ncbi:MAG TPA: NTP transferase domain-containing protein [Candidatus Ratteibacteria bacterium]|nr:NTP transferase domain-containing protein [bacterium]HRS05624.1 NTP transferase domain-containing protein [Candidatus Ratteibacteria bacterium]